MDDIFYDKGLSSGCVYGKDGFKVLRWEYE